MLSVTRSAAGRSTLTTLSAHSRTAPRRTLLKSAWSALGNQYVDLAIALPFPPGFPSYTATIVIVALAIRIVTAPLHYWMLKRRWRSEEVVRPAVLASISAARIMAHRKLGLIRPRLSIEEMKQRYNRDFPKELARIQSELEKKHHCHSWVTAGVPIVGQMLPFLAASLTFRHVALPPTPFDAESFMTLTTLSNIDQTTSFPIALGLITLANVEMSSWLKPLRPETKRSLDSNTGQAWMIPENEKEEATQVVNKALTQITFRAVMKTFLRGLSLFRVVVASYLPGGVLIFWTASSAFGLAQTLLVNYVDRRHRLVHPLTVSPPLPRMTESTPGPPSKRNTRPPPPSPTSKVVQKGQKGQVVQVGQVVQKGQRREPRR